MKPLGALIAAGVIALLIAGGAAGRVHHLHLPPTNLPHSMTVDEWEWHVQPSQPVVASGLVHFQGYDRGMDDHDMQLIGPHGVIDTVYMVPGSSASMTVRLPPGHYQLICSLYEGTPQSHYAKGMHAWITVR
jgi:uncharacterized cupredoxin-like copper-binding protein